MNLVVLFGSKIGAALFCHVDDFCQAFEGSWIRYQLTTSHRRRRRAGHLCLSEIMTLLIGLAATTSVAGLLISPITGSSKPSTCIISICTYAMLFLD